MELRRVHDLRSPDGFPVPAYLVAPQTARGGAAIAHGYGGSKEQMLGLATRLAEAGWASLVVDLRGHGEHPAPLDDRVAGDLDAAVGYLGRYGTVAAVGHSLGGRLALGSRADLVVALSPAVARRPSPEGRGMLLAFGSTTVRSPRPDYILELVRAPQPLADRDRPTLLIHGQGDVPSLVEGIASLGGELSHSEIAAVTTHQHPAAMLDAGVLPYLHHWFNHGDLKFNREVFDRVVAWLRAR